MNTEKEGIVETPVQSHSIEGSGSKELAPVNTVFSNFPTESQWNTLKVIAQTFKDGGVLPASIDTVQKMVIALQAGREIGLQPIEAMNSLYFVNGKIAMYGAAVPNQILRAGHKIRWSDCNAETATVTITRGDNGESMTSTFTMAEAQKRGYTKNPVYAKYPENMLKWRVLGMTATFICPDALRGIGIKEEMETEIIDVNGKFHSKKESERIKKEVIDGSYNKKRKTLDDVLDEPDEQSDDSADQDVEDGE